MRPFPLLPNDRRTRSWRELPLVGIIRNADKNYIDRSPCAVNIQNESVLCIGYSESEIEQYVEHHRPQDITVITNWVGHRDAEVKKYPIIFGDITTTTSLPDDHFGAVLTLSLMEHLSDVESGLREIKRVLKPGGYLFAFFGPAWSCPYGHHLYLTGGEPLLDFSLWRLPAYIHLLCSENEIARFVTDNGLVDGYVDWYLKEFYETPIINRVMYDDYMRLFSEYFQVIASEVSYNEVPGNIVDELRTSYAPYRDFTSYGGGYTLRKTF
jgi:SAM-dependent methyltransferase